MLKAGSHELQPFWCGLCARNHAANLGDPDDEMQSDTATRAITHVAVLQASAQFIYFVIMGVGLTFFASAHGKVAEFFFHTWPHTGLLWRLLLWALYFGLLTQQLADRATRYQASCA